MAAGDGTGFEVGMTIQNDWHASFALSETLKESDFWVSAIAQDDNQKVQAKSYFSTQVCFASLLFSFLNPSSLSTLKLTGNEVKITEKSGVGFHESGLLEDKIRLVGPLSLMNLENRLLLLASLTFLLVFIS